ncbi:MAG: ATP synthase F1 subunit delta, partial [Deltaproteobacteria bacterium]|nr:ATP synthase F1 subunit delta [Deltaproteobacteria bacterium]
PSQARRGHLPQHAGEGALVGALNRAAAAADGAFAALCTPAYPREVLGRALAEVVAKSDLDPLVGNFLLLLHKKGRFACLPQIAAAYDELADELDGLVRGTVTSASPLAEGELSAVRGALSILTGSKVELKVVVDPGVIGGLVARLGDLVVDTSLRTQLDRVGSLLTA